MAFGWQLRSDRMKRFQLAVKSEQSRARQFDTKFRQDDEAARIRGLQRPTLGPPRPPPLPGPFPSPSDAARMASYRTPSQIAGIDQGARASREADLAARQAEFQQYGVPTVSTNDRAEASRLLDASGIPMTGAERRRVAQEGPEVARQLIGQGNIGPVSDIGSPHRASGNLRDMSLAELFDEEPLPGVAGKFLGGPAGAVSALGTAGIGTFGSTGARLGVGLGGIVAPPYAAEEAAKIDPRLALPAGLAAGVLAGGIGGFAGARAQTAAGQVARAGARNAPDALRAFNANEVGGTRLGGDDLSQATNDLGQPRLPTTTSDSVVSNAPPLTETPRMGAGEEPRAPEAQRHIDEAERYLETPGKVTQVPGLKSLTSMVNEAVTMPRKIFAARNAQQAARAGSVTRYTGMRVPTVRALKDAWATSPAQYIGPEGKPLAGELVDWLQHPSLYDGASPELIAARGQLNAVGDDIIDRSVSGYGVDVNRYKPAEDGAIYVPHMGVKDDIDDAAKKLADTYTSGSQVTQPGVTKTRYWDALDERMAADPTFTPETDIEVLFNAHDRGLANANANKTFKLAAGGKTYEEVMREVHPDWTVIPPDSSQTGRYVRANDSGLFYLPEDLAAVNRSGATRFPFGHGVLDWLEEIRATTFGPDFSPLVGVQAPLGWFANPITSSKALPGMIKSLGDPQAMLVKLMKEEPEMVARYSEQRGRAFGQFGQEFGQTNAGAMRIGPLREGTDRMMAALEYQQYRMWKTDRAISMWLNKGIDPVVAEEAASQVLGEVVPALNPVRTGRSAARAKAERGLFVSTSFMASPALLLKDAASGMAKLGLKGGRWTKISPREQLAIIRTTTMAGSLIGAGVTSWVMAGKSPEDALKTVTDYNDRRFLSVAIPGTNRFIPIGGPFRSFVKAIAPQPVKVGGETIYVPFMGTPRWLKNKTLGIVTAPIDLYRNKDFYGAPIMKGGPAERIGRGIWYGMESVLPLSLGAVSEGVRTGASAADTVEQAIGQFFGGDVRKPTPGEYRTEEIGAALRGSDDSDVRAQAGSPKQDLDVPALNFIEGNDKVKALSDQIDARQRLQGDKWQLAADQVESTRAEIRTRQDDADKAFEAGGVDPQTYVDDTNARQLEAWIATKQAYKSAGIEFGDRDRKNQPVFAALDNYWNVEMEIDPKTQEKNYDKFDAEREAALAPLSDSQRAAAMAYLERNRTPLEKKMGVAEKLRGQYYDMPEWKPEVKNQDVIDEIYARETELRREAANMGGENIPSDKIYREIGRRWPEYAEGDLMAALKLKSEKWSDRMANPDKLTHLRRWRRELELFFPNLYGTGVLVELSGVSQ